jgi:hypothetical protein
VSLLNLNSKSLDYVKLVLLLGDNYLLSEFERTANTYCKSTLKELESKVKYRTEQVTEALATMKSGLNEKAGALIAKSSGGKFYSIHDQEGYIEFRSPGGDWLGDTFFDKIEDSLLRMVVAVDAACDPGKHDREYAKKLYKLLSPALRATKMEAFHTQLTQYLSGEMSEEKMAQFISSETAAREMRKAKAAENDALAAELAPTKKYWWRVALTGSNAEIELVASSREDAIEWARVEWRMTSDRMRQNYPDTLFIATPLRKYIEEPATPDETPPAEPVAPVAPATPPRRGDRRWVVVDAAGDTVFYFWNRNDQGEANAAAAHRLRTTYSSARHRGPFEVYPATT